MESRPLPQQTRLQELRPSSRDHAHHYNRYASKKYAQATKTTPITTSCMPPRTTPRKQKRPRKHPEEFKPTIASEVLPRTTPSKTLSRSHAHNHTSNASTNYAQEGILKKPRPSQSCLQAPRPTTACLLACLKPPRWHKTGGRILKVPIPK